MAEDHIQPDFGTDGKQSRKYEKKKKKINTKSTFWRAQTALLCTSEKVSGKKGKKSILLKLKCSFFSILLLFKASISTYTMCFTYTWTSRRECTLRHEEFGLWPAALEKLCLEKWMEIRRTSRCNLCRFMFKSASIQMERQITIFPDEGRAVEEAL